MTFSALRLLGPFPMMRAPTFPSFACENSFARVGRIQLSLAPGAISH